MVNKVTVSTRVDTITFLEDASEHQIKVLLSSTNVTNNLPLISSLFKYDGTCIRSYHINKTIWKYKVAKQILQLVYILQ